MFSPRRLFSQSGLLAPSRIRSCGPGRCRNDGHDMWSTPLWLVVDDPVRVAQRIARRGAGPVTKIHACGEGVVTSGRVPRRIMWKRKAGNYLGPRRIARRNLGCKTRRRVPREYDGPQRCRGPHSSHTRDRQWWRHRKSLYALGLPTGNIDCGGWCELPRVDGRVRRALSRAVVL